MPRLADPSTITVTLLDAKDLWRTSMLSDHKAPKTISTYLFAVDRMIEYLGPAKAVWPGHSTRP